jgi:hypothetical protein
LRPKRPKRETETPEWLAFMARILRAWSRRAGDGDPDALRALYQQRAEIDAALVDAVAMLRHEPHNWSWNKVADALGVRPQAAQQRFGKVGGSRRVGGQPGHLRDWSPR